MNKIPSENLYLLEFLVDTINIDEESVPILSRVKSLGESCVQFKFLDNKPIELCEADFQPPQEYSQLNEKGVTKNGKSVLFRLNSVQAMMVAYSFPVHVSVFKKLQSNESDRLLVGKCEIQIKDLFNTLVSSSTTSPQKAPLAQALQDTFVLEGVQGSVGTIDVFLRICSFGKMIVTGFQMNPTDKSITFKNEQGATSSFEYKKVRKAQTKDL